MVDVVSTISTAASVDGPFRVDVADAFQALRASAGLSFSCADPFTDILGDLLVLAEHRGSETAFSVDAGFSHSDPGCEACIHARKLKISNPRFSELVLCHGTFGRSKGTPCSAHNL